jgi:hypothetical protein
MNYWFIRSRWVISFRGLGKVGPKVALEYFKFRGLTPREWGTLNSERGRLIVESINRRLTAEENRRLKHFNKLADVHLEPFDDLREASLELAEQQAGIRRPRKGDS